MRPFRNGNDNSRGRSYPTNEGPLLQSELQNLDMELEILKRQREIIFKQRQVENQLFSQRLSTFNQPSSSSFGRSEPKQNYNTDYSASYSNPTNSKGYKRPSERSYDHPAPKQARSNNWGDKYDYKQPNKPQPLMNIPTQQYKKVTKPVPNKKPKPFEPRGNNASYRPQKDFHTSPPKAKFNKTSDKTVAPVVRNTLPEKKKSYTSDDVLRPGVVPNPSVNGRLELALGELLKRIRTSQLLSEDQKRQLTLGGGIRSVKTILRQRLSTVMMNKQVRAMVDIVAQYKKTYPEDIDDEITEAIGKAVVTRKEKVNLKHISRTETERIHIFFKTRINTLLRKQVQNMIDNLFKMYGDNEAEILKCIKDLPELEENKETEEQNKDAATDVEMVESSGNEANNDNTQENIVESDKMTAENNPADVEIVQNKASNDNAQEDIAASTENTAENNCTDVTIDLTNAENDGTEEKSAVQTDENQVEMNNKRSKLQQYYQLMDLLIENRLPKLLLNFKDEFAKIMYCEKDFIIGKEMIMRELKETLRKSLYAANNMGKEATTTVEAGKASTLNQGPDSITPVKENNNDAAEKMDVENQNKSDKQVDKQNVIKPAPQTVQKGSQLYVMLLGRPSLPAKAEIYDFLNKFNPKSIKKHKTVNNLLVIGFENKQDYDKILEANETKVGDATFIIKANEVIASDKQKEKTTTDKNNSAVETVSSQKTGEINKATEEKVGETKEKDETENDDVKESDEKITDETKVNNGGQVEENIGENMEKNKESSIQEVNKTDENSTEINDVNKSSTEVTDVNNEVTETLDKNNEENVIAEKDKESPDANDKVDDNIEGNVKTDDVKGTNKENKDITDEVSNLETIQESEETEKEVKAKTRAGAVATPTRSSSRLANTTPSTIKTRRTSRLAQ